MSGKIENESILREEADAVRARLKVILFKSGCSYCKIQPSIREVASLIKVDNSSFTKFINEEVGHVGLRRKTYNKICLWLEKVE